jgi:hypothetical protein
MSLADRTSKILPLLARGSLLLGRKEEGQYPLKSGYRKSAKCRHYRSALGGISGYSKRRNNQLIELSRTHRDGLWCDWILGAIYREQTWCVASDMSNLEGMC